ncbi:hypothetical protein LCGC14_1910280 [marine sediment metagenome]|uniref:Uncharacterized protein n=1 Tax=marine sediment metagenome TaxID=412755 RepID=A0A0F9FUE2_9ZZZZ
MDLTIIISVFGTISVTGIFWGGYKLGTIETRIKNHEALATHEASRKIFIPRTEMDSKLTAITSDIKEIKEDIRIIRNGR